MAQLIVDVLQIIQIQYDGCDGEGALAAEAFKLVRKE